MGAFCVWSMYYNVVVRVLSCFAIILLRAGGFPLIEILLSYGYLCSVSLPRGAMGWSVVFDCGISRSCSNVCFCYVIDIPL